MKLFNTTLPVLAFFFFSTVAQAGVIIGGTRLVYDGGKKESSLQLSNPDKKPYLIQSWVESSTGEKKAPFIITPPLFRLDNGQDNVLRVVRAGGNLPENKESLFWINIKTIPSVEKNSDANTLQIAVKTRMKLFYRPAGLKGSPEEAAASLKWTNKGNALQVTNNSPFYLTFHEVKMGGVKLPEATMVAPMGSLSIKLPANARSGEITWKIINDYGGISQLFPDKK